MPNNNWRIQLEAILNQASVANIQKELDKHKVKIGVEIEKEASLKSINTLANAMASFRDNNTKMTKDMKNRLNDMYKTLINGSNLSQAEVSELRTRFSQLKLEVRDAGKLGKSFGDSIKSGMSSFATWLPASQLIMSGVNSMRDMVEAVKDVDSAMIELRKVSDASNNELKNYFDEAAESAKKLGAAVSDVINATADWSRLGYNLEDSKTLAEVAILYKNVGDGIDVDTANESLISTLRGFQLEAKDAMNIVDQFNEVDILAS